MGTESACSAGDEGSIPGSGRSPGGGHGNPLQCSSLESPMDRGAWWATVHGVAKSRTGLSDRAGTQCINANHDPPLCPPTSRSGNYKEINQTKKDKYDVILLICGI